MLLRYNKSTYKRRFTMAKNTLPEGNLKDGSGRKEHQRMKHFLVYMYLLKYTDEANAATGEVIADDLKKKWGINAERRSIYKDIRELNIAFIMVDKGCSFAKAEKLLDENEKLETIKYSHPHGYYVARRPISPKNARLLAECIYNARFIPEEKERQLIKQICTFLSEAHRDKIDNKVFNIDRLATNNADTIKNLDEINKALRKVKINGKNCCRQIQFNYLKYTIQDLEQPIERKHGEKYIVSPYEVLISEGNYYLIGLNEKQKLTTYRIDRMKNVGVLNVPREQTEECKNLDKKDYLKRVISMYSGKRQSVEIRFINPLLDTVIDRFGTSAGTTYSKVDENHFLIRTSIEVSDQFFAWICGFGKKAKITYPESVVTAFKDFLDKIQSIY